MVQKIVVTTALIHVLHTMIYVFRVKGITCVELRLYMVAVLSFATLTMPGS